MTCPDKKEEQFAKQKKIKVFEDIDLKNFHDLTDTVMWKSNPHKS